MGFALVATRQSTDCHVDICIDSVLVRILLLAFGGFETHN